MATFSWLITCILFWLTQYSFWARIHQWSKRLYFWALVGGRGTTNFQFSSRWEQKILKSAWRGTGVFSTYLSKFQEPPLVVINHTFLIAPHRRLLQKTFVGFTQPPCVDEDLSLNFKSKSQEIQFPGVLRKFLGKISVRITTFKPHLIKASELYLNDKNPINDDKHFNQICRLFIYHWLFSHLDVSFWFSGLFGCWSR